MLPKEAYLQKLFEFVNDVRGCALLFATTDVRRRLDDVSELVCQIILTAHRATIDSDTRSYRGRGYRKNREDHPLWPGILD